MYNIVKDILAKISEKLYNYNENRNNHQEEIYLGMSTLR